VLLEEMLPAAVAGVSGAEAVALAPGGAGVADRVRDAVAALARGYPEGTLAFGMSVLAGDAGANGHPAADAQHGSGDPRGPGAGDAGTGAPGTGGSGASGLTAGGFAASGLRPGAGGSGPASGDPRGTGTGGPGTGVSGIGGSGAGSLAAGGLTTRGHRPGAGGSGPGRAGTGGPGAGWTVAGAGRAVADARQAGRLAALLGRGVRLVDAAEFGSVGLLLATVPEEVRRAFRASLLGPLLAYDREHGTELVRTLRVFLDCSGSWTKAAEAMFVHVNSLRYRIGRVQDLTGRDLSTLADQAALLLALRLAGSAEDQGTDLAAGGGVEAGQVPAG
jgi:hypothetical protein